MRSSLLFLSPLALPALVQAATVGPVGTLNIANAVIAPDGHSRPVVLANGIHPGPLVVGNQGDTFSMNVVNNLTDGTMLRSTSVHWHGILQHGTNWADGPVGVNQCPISPGNSFLYQFSVPDQAGTFWYHSHFGTQYCDGLRGPLVIYNPNDPLQRLYDVDNEDTVIVLSEWYHTQAPSISGPASANATLINGKGRYVGGPATDLAVVNVHRGKRYRMRLVSVSCEPNFVFSIDGHSLTIIEADGQETIPHTVDSLQIFAGQRYSFILNANQPVGNYWIRALPNSGFNGLATGFTNGTNSAILRYAGAPAQDPTTTQLASPQLLLETDLHPLNPALSAAPGQPFPGGADVNLNLALGFSAGAFTINNASWVTPSVPVLLQIMSGSFAAQDLLPAGSVYPLPANSTIEVSIPGGLLGGPHPFHLHGHAFSVVQSAGNSTNNYVNPVRRDVVSLGGAGSNVTIRFVTDNAGPWILHCHIDFHLAAGLAIVFAEDAPDTARLNAVPTLWDQLCPTYNALPSSATEVQLVPIATSA